MFRMSIKHPKEKRMGVFDWFTDNYLFLTRCREIPASFIQRVQWQDFSQRAGKKGFIKEDRNRRGIQNFILQFLLQNFSSSLIMHPWFALGMSSTGVGRFIGFTSLHWKKHLTDRNRKNLFQLPKNISHRCWQKQPGQQAEKF